MSWSHDNTPNLDPRTNKLRFAVVLALTYGSVVLGATYNTGSEYQIQL